MDNQGKYGYNFQPQEEGNAREYRDSFEQASYAESPRYGEAASAREYGGEKKPPRRKPKTDRSKLLLGLLTATVVVTTGAGAGVFTPKSTGRAELMEFGADYDFIFYHVEVESEYEVEAVLYNEFTHRVVLLENGGNGGEFLDLQPNREYVFVVVEKYTFGEKELLRQTVSTADSPL